MLKYNQMVVRHPIFKTIRLKRKFAEVLQLDDFRQLAFKSQLGTKSISKEILNAKHTRLMHSIGVMHLTSKLLDVCEKKFSRYFTITQQERESLELAALGHDIGHIAFSHSLEALIPDETHEERTIKIFKKNAEKINEIFGYDITSSVIRIYTKNIEVKRQGNQVKSEGKLDILNIFTNLLIGTIDCDRIEYIMTDRHMIYGEQVDFTEIFENITLVLINNTPVVAFEKEAVPKIENLLFTRLDNSTKDYYEKDGTILQIAVQEFIKQSGWKKEQIETVSEFEILAQMQKVLRDDSKINTIQYRTAEIVLKGKRENILYKKFENDEKYKYFLKRLYAVTSRRDIIKELKARINVYNPNKNKVYIKDEDGVVKDITQVSNKTLNLSVSQNCVMIDIDRVYGLSDEEIKNIKSLFEDNPVEVEKKFIFPESYTNKGYVQIEEVQKALEEISGLKQSKYWIIIVNEDIYLEPTIQIPKGIAMRNRKTAEGESYCIKIPSEDGTSITKREEYEYKNCKNLSEFLKLAEELIKIENMQVEEGVTIVTHRKKELIESQDSIIEISIDFSTYKYKGKIAEEHMLECELKQGDELSLWYLTKHLKKLGFIETNESKKARGKKALGIK